MGPSWSVLVLCLSCCLSLSVARSFRENRFSPKNSSAIEELRGIVGTLQLFPDPHSQWVHEADVYMSCVDDPDTFKANLSPSARERLEYEVATLYGTSLSSDAGVQDLVQLFLHFVAAANNLNLMEATSHLDFSCAPNSEFQQDPEEESYRGFWAAESKCRSLTMMPQCWSHQFSAVVHAADFDDFRKVLEEVEGMTTQEFADYVRQNAATNDGSLAIWGEDLDERTQFLEQGRVEFVRLLEKSDAYEDAGRSPLLLISWSLGLDDESASAADLLVRRRSKATVSTSSTVAKLRQQFEQDTSQKTPSKKVDPEPPKIDSAPAPKYRSLPSPPADVIVAVQTSKPRPSEMPSDMLERLERNYNELVKQAEEQKRLQAAIAEEQRVRQRDELARLEEEKRLKKLIESRTRVKFDGVEIFYGPVSETNRPIAGDAVYFYTSFDHYTVLPAKFVSQEDDWKKLVVDVQCLAPNGDPKGHTTISASDLLDYDPFFSKKAVFETRMLFFVRQTLNKLAECSAALSFGKVFTAYRHTAQGAVVVSGLSFNTEHVSWLHIRRLPAKWSPWLKLPLEKDKSDTSQIGSRVYVVDDVAKGTVRAAIVTGRDEMKVKAMPVFDDQTEIVVDAKKLVTLESVAPDSLVFATFRPGLIVLDKLASEHKFRLGESSWMPVVGETENVNLALRLSSKTFKELEVPWTHVSALSSATSSAPPLITSTAQVSQLIKKKKLGAPVYIADATLRTLQPAVVVDISDPVDKKMSAPIVVRPVARPGSGAAADINTFESAIWTNDEQGLNPGDLLQFKTLDMSSPSICAFERMDPSGRLILCSSHYLGDFGSYYDPDRVVVPWDAVMSAGDLFMVLKNQLVSELAGGLTISSSVNALSAGTFGGFVFRGDTLYGMTNQHVVMDVDQTTDPTLDFAAISLTSDALLPSAEKQTIGTLFAAFCRKPAPLEYGLSYPDGRKKPKDLSEEGEKEYRKEKKISHIALSGREQHDYALFSLEKLKNPPRDCKILGGIGQPKGVYGWEKQGDKHYFNKHAIPVMKYGKRTRFTRGLLTLKERQFIVRETVESGKKITSKVALGYTFEVIGNSLPTSSKTSPHKLLVYKDGDVLSPKVKDSYLPADQALTETIFSQAGDSGSFILDHKKRVIGLLDSGRWDYVSRGKYQKLTFGSTIDAVMAHLNAFAAKVVPKKEEESMKEKEESTKEKEEETQPTTPKSSALSNAANALFQICSDDTPFKFP